MVGPVGVLVYLVMGVLTLFTALNYAELGAAIPIAGGGYSFVARTQARPLAFFTGWFFWIGNTLACAMYAVIFALTVRTYLWPGASVPLLVILTTAVFAAVNLRGMSEAIKVITVMNLIELAVLIGVAVLGFSHVEAPNLQPLAPHGYGNFFPAMALIYVSYVGFELITVASEEIVDPARTIPRAILITMFVGIAIYVLVVFVMMGTVGHEELAHSEVPFIYTADRLFGAWGRFAAITATIMASLSAFSVTLGASARVLYALGRDRHFPSLFATLHKRYRTPHISLAICAVMAALFGSLGLVAFAAALADFGFLMALGIVNFSVIGLRRRMPNLMRPFQVALYPVVPIIGIVSCFIFVPMLEPIAFVLGGGLTLLGAAVYLHRPANRAELMRATRVWPKLRSWLGWRRKKRMRVLIIGGGSTGQNIANRLLVKDELRLVFRASEHQITFIDSNDEVCQELSQRYNVPVFQGDGTKRQLLEQVGAENIDVVIAATDADGSNVIAGMECKRLGMNKVIAIVRDPDYVPLIEESGLMAISAPWATAAMVENLLDRPGIADLFEIGTGVASLVGVVVPEGARVAGEAIQDIDVPKECVVAAVIRGKAFVVPRGGTVIEAGDHVVFVGPTAAVKKANDRFSLKATEE